MKLTDQIDLQEECLVASDFLEEHGFVNPSKVLRKFGEVVIIEWGVIYFSVNQDKWRLAQVFNTWRNAMDACWEWRHHMQLSRKLCKVIKIKTMRVFETPK